MEESWCRVLDGILLGARASRRPLIVASTLPALLADASADRLLAAGIPAIAGLREGLQCAAALGVPPGDPARLLEIAAAARGGDADAGPRARPPTWLAEHEAKAMLAGAGIAVAEGSLAASEDEAVALLTSFGPPVALKLSRPGLRHKSEAGALELGLSDETGVRGAFRRLRELGEGEILVERMVPSGVELLVSARRDGVVPALVLGLGGIWTEALGDAAVVPLPASPARVERAMRSLRGWPLLSGGAVARPSTSRPPPSSPPPWATSCSASDST